MRCLACGGSGTRAGAREAFIPRPGRVFAQADFPQLELHTLAQCCVSWFGESKLAEALNAGLDPHLLVASLIVGCSYEEAKKALKDKKHPLHKQVKENRGAAKPANFGWPGGLGPTSYVDYAKRGYGVVVSITKAKEIKRHWEAAWPEMPRYFARVNALCANEANRAFVETLFTRRFRGNATYCAACNNGFQALGADCAKEAHWRVTRAAYVGTPSTWWTEKHPGPPGAISPMFNARPVAFVHDELISEVDEAPGPYGDAHDAAMEQAALMIEGANKYLPDVPIPMSKMEPLLMRRWSKKAEPTFGNDGRLVAWAA